MLTRLTCQAVGLTHAPWMIADLMEVWSCYQVDTQVSQQLLQQHVYLAVTDMFFDYPFDLDANDKECVQQYGIHSQYNWAAYK